MDSKQLRTLKALTEHLEGINPTNTDPATGQPYARDLTGKVYRGRSVLPMREAQDGISLWEYPRQDLYAPVGEHGLSGCTPGSL
jgi:hypothetical protein